MAKPKPLHDATTSEDKSEALAPREPAELATVPHMRIVAPGEFAESHDLPAKLGMSSEWDEAPSSLTPMADFESSDAPCFIRGEYLGLKELDFGGRKQIIWRLRIPSGEEVGVWDSAILHDRMFRLNADVGDELVIAYLGDTPTSRGLNPAHMFRVWRKRTISP